MHVIRGPVQGVHDPAKSPLAPRILAVGRVLFAKQGVIGECLQDRFPDHFLGSKVSLGYQVRAALVTHRDVAASVKQQSARTPHRRLAYLQVAGHQSDSRAQVGALPGPHASSCAAAPGR